jgi:hypothetical protein
MALPLRLIWNLRMKPRQKLSIGGLFCFGWVCIIVSTIRVVKLGEGTATGVPAPSWLALWATIEASIGMLSFLTFSPALTYFSVLTAFSSHHDRMLPGALSRH